MAVKTEYEKMLAGELYSAGDTELLLLRIKARNFIQVYNQTVYDPIVRTTMLHQFLRKTGSNIEIQTPFFCDYGCHISIGNNFFANFNCVFLDCNYINIGDNVFLGPNVQLYAATHPVIASERIKGPELAIQIKIGNNVWIGGGTIICPGVTIGKNSTIGAGSVVVKNIPSNVVAAGNPCRVIKEL